MTGVHANLDPDQAEALASGPALTIEPLPRPSIEFDPALLEDPSIPDACERFRVDGLRQLLHRYGGQQSPKNALARLDDPLWLAAWDRALAACAGQRVVLHGGELGVFALRALHHGAEHALCAARHPLDARIATGMAQKHFLAPWHALHGEAIASWPDAQKRESFEAFAQGIDIVLAEDMAEPAAQAQRFVFTEFDHTLLGTGIVAAVRRFQSATTHAHAASVLPARARVFAMAIQWCEPAPPWRLAPLDAVRWSLYPQPLPPNPASAPPLWRAMTEPVEVGAIDFAGFESTRWSRELAVVADGRIDALVYWFELDLGETRIDNAPGGELRCIRPALQYLDGFDARAGERLPLSVQVGETRMWFKTGPAPRRMRTRMLPGWYLPMLGDHARNQAYREAIEAAVSAHTPDTVLDIGAGCGLLSMMAAEAGAPRVIGCESDATIRAIGEATLALNGHAAAVSLVGKDCRALSVPADLPRRADLAVFELFDCSLIGEGVLHFIAHAREHLLSEHARYLPAAARLRAMLIEYRRERIWDIDANLLNPYRYSPGFINVDAAALDYRALSEPFDLFEFEFASAGPQPQSRTLSLPASASGTVGAVLFWFDLRLDEERWLSNAPGTAQPPHWQQGLQFLPEVRVQAGAALPLLAEHDGSALRLRWPADAIAAEALSTLPRFDPRWLAAHHELEQQMRGLMQHCAQHPDEYRQVARIAQHFAIDPGAHGLDPAIAHRFASMFFAA